jgi:hypothetical protein
VRVKRLVYFTFFIFLSMPPPRLFADETAILFTPLSAAGSEGTHTAVEEGVFTLLGNPALLHSTSESMFFALSFGVGDVFQDGKLDFVPSAAYYTISPAFGTVSKGVGYGVFGQIYFRYSQAVVLDLIAAAGFDWVLVSTERVKLDFGLSHKALFLYTLTQTGRKTDMNTLIALYITPGILLSLGNRFSVGISLDNMLSLGHSNKNGLEFMSLPPLFNAGIAVDIIETAALGLSLFADYRLFVGDRDMSGLFNSDAGNSLHRLGGGVRAEIRHSVWFSLGAADFVTKFVPAAGIGFNLGAIKLDMTYYFDYSAQAGIRIVRNY